MVVGRRGGWRAFALFVVASAAAVGLVTVGGAPSSAAPFPAAIAPGAPSTSTSLPALPKVDPKYTDGQSPAKLLANAITLASVGIDSTAVQAAIASTQAHLDKDATKAAELQEKAEVADQVAARARAQAQQSLAAYHSLDSAVKSAAIFLYTEGPNGLTVNPAAGQELAYAESYASTAITPEGVLATQARYAADERRAQALARKAQRTADAALKKAAKLVAAEQAEEKRLVSELAAISQATAAAVSSDHSALASQASAELLSATSLQFTPKQPLPSLLSTTPVALTWAFSELGKPYVWGATGPNSFDCSGLTQFVWKQAGVSIPRVAADQDSWTIPVPLSQLLPGDLVFYGKTDIHHVGIYIGDGLMINAPHTGTVVQVSSIWWSDLNGFGRVHDAGVPIPPHNPPTVQAPAKPVVVPTKPPVPSQTAPPKGWKPKPGETTPIRVSSNPSPPTTTVPVSTTTLPVPTTTLPAPATTIPVSTTTSTSTSTTSVPDTTTTLVPGA